jgi:hypothetical protein
MRHSVDFGFSATVTTQVISCLSFDCFDLFGHYCLLHAYWQACRPASTFLTIRDETPSGEETNGKVQLQALRQPHSPTVGRHNDKKAASEVTERPAI